jgi:hypothetical protein
MRWWLFLAVVTACGGGDGPAVVIEGAPVIMLSEGVEAVADIDIVDAPSDGDCAPPFEPGDFDVTVDSGAGEFFDSLKVEGAQGSVHLVIEPRCDAVAFGDGDSLVTMTVSTASGCAAPAEARLQIADTLGVACSPAVSAWVGDCSAEPDDASTSVEIASGANPGPLCVRFASRDPATETLMVRTATSAPPQFIDPADAPTEETPFVGARIFTVPLGDSTHIRGPFTLSYEVYEGDDPDTGALVRSGDIELIVGEPGVSIHAPFTNIPGFNVVEFGSTAQLVRVFRLKDESGEPAGQLCARATRSTDEPVDVPFLDRDKPYLSLTDFEAGTRGGGNEWVCGSDFKLAVSPPIDAPEIETVQLSAAVCDCADPANVTRTGDVLAMREISMNVVSKAEWVTCDVGAPTDPDLVVACADFFGDDTPELVFRSANGSNDRTCVYSGANRRLEPADWAAGSGAVVPDWISSMKWHEPDTAEPRNVIVGQVPAGLVALTMMPGNPPVARWRSINIIGMPVALATTPVPLRAATTLSRTAATGATHVAYPDGRNIEIRCLTEDDADIGLCERTMLPDVAELGHTIDHIARGDLDGDGQVDLVAFIVDGGDPGILTMEGIRLNWDTNGHVDEIDRQTVMTGPSVFRGNHFRSGRVARDNCPGTATDCDAIYAAVTDPLDDVARLIRVRLTDSLVLAGDTVPTLNAVFDATSFEGQLIVGMQFGVAQADAQNSSFVDWIPRDPVLQEYGLVGPTLTPAPGYGLNVAVCRVDHGSVPSIAFTTSTSTAILTGLDVDVELP